MKEETALKVFKNPTTHVQMNNVSQNYCPFDFHTKTESVIQNQFNRHDIRLSDIHTQMKTAESIKLSQQSSFSLKDFLQKQDNMKQMTAMTSITQFTKLADQSIKYESLQKELKSYVPSKTQKICRDVNRQRVQKISNHHK